MTNYKYKSKLKNNKIKYTHKKIHKEKIVSFKSRRICPILSKEHLSIFYIYIGIINTLISGNTKYNVNYNHLYFGKNKKNADIIDNTKSFTLIETTRCYFYTSDIESNLYTDIDEYGNGNDNGNGNSDSNKNENNNIEKYIDIEFNKEFTQKDNILYYDVKDSNDNYMFISFNIGIPKYYDTTKPLYYYIKKDKIRVDNKIDNKIDNKTNNKGTIIYKPRFYELITLIYNIKTYLETNKYKKIVLCGHSRGMTIATLSAYILLILSVDEDIRDTLPKHHNVKEFISELRKFISDNQKQEQYLKEKLSKDKLSKENSLKNKDNKNNKDNTALFKELKEIEHINLISKDIFNLKLIRNQIQNNISICGTGCYPILWTKVEEFNIFNQFYKHNYIHIISGSKNNNIQIYDNISYYNKFIYIYERIIEQYKNYNTIDNKNNTDDKNNTFKKLKQLKNIKYVYYNFGSVVLNLIDNHKMDCFIIDKLFNKIEAEDKKYTFQDIIYKTKTFNNYHKFEFYIYLFNKYMNFF